MVLFPFIRAGIPAFGAGVKIRLRFQTGGCCVNKLKNVNLKEKFAMRNNDMGDIEQRVRFGLGSAAAAVAIFAPLDYKWKGILTGIAASTILTGIYRISPAKRFVGM